MAGPAASLLLSTPLTEEQIDDLDAWLRKNTSNLQGTRLDWHPFWIEDGTPLGITEDCSIEPCAFGLGAEEPLHYLEEWEKTRVIELISYAPQQELGFYAGCNRSLDHRILGHLALFLAERYDGLINLSGALTPPLKHDRRYTLAEYPWYTLEEVHEFVQGLPGRVIEVFYGEDVGKPWVYHIVDATFMRAWLKHPHFHMIK